MQGGVVAAVLAMSYDYLLIKLYVMDTAMIDRLCGVITVLCGRIQAGERIYHHSRCIEWLVDIIRGSVQPQQFMNWLDNGDKEDFRTILGL